MRKVIASFGEMIADTAQQKHAAAVARRHPDGSAEKPADVSRHCLASVAERLASDGYVAKAGGRRLLKQVGDFSYLIWFQLDRNNVAGQRVAVWTHAGVESRRLKQWLGQQEAVWARAPPYSGGFAGGQIGNLRPPRSWMEWDFADPERRAAMVDGLVHAIREIVFPFFADYSDPVSALATSLKDGPPHLVTTVEFAHAHFGKERAEEVVRHFLAQRPEMLDPFLSAIKFCRKEGFPRGMGNGARDLAAITALLGLDPGIG